MPLLVYGMDIDIETDVTIDNFADLMTDDGPNPDASWNEFMPKGVTKEIYKKFANIMIKISLLQLVEKLDLLQKVPMNWNQLKEWQNSRIIFFI